MQVVKSSTQKWINDKFKAARTLCITTLKINHKHFFKRILSTLSSVLKHTLRGRNTYVCNRLPWALRNKVYLQLKQIQQSIPGVNHCTMKTVHQKQSFWLLVTFFVFACQLPIRKLLAQLSIALLRSLISLLNYTGIQPKDEANWLTTNWQQEGSVMMLKHCFHYLT